MNFRIGELDIIRRRQKNQASPRGRHSETRLESREDSYDGKIRSAAPSSLIRAAERILERYWRAKYERFASLTQSLGAISYSFFPTEPSAGIRIES